MNTKICTKCGQDKPFSDYYKQKTGRFGLRPSCKDCITSQNRQYALSNPEKVKGHKDAWVDRNRDKHYGNVSRWRRANPEKHRASQAKRRSSKLNATPQWLTEDQHKDIEAMYFLANRYTKLFGLEYHVDHIIPLQGKNICGLHVPWNLQLLEASMNLSKSNKLKEASM